MTEETPKKILIADDSQAFRDLEGSYLQRQGFELIYAENGAKAIRLARQEQPDLILLDIQMPLMDGVQALAILKGDDATKDIPIVVITTISRDEDKEILRTGGADAVISKPVQGPRILETVERLLR